MPATHERSSRTTPSSVPPHRIRSTAVSTRSVHSHRPRRTSAVRPVGTDADARTGMPSGGRRAPRPRPGPSPSANSSPPHSMAALRPVKPAPSGRPSPTALISSRCVTGSAASAYTSCRRPPPGRAAQLLLREQRLTRPPRSPGTRARRAAGGRAGGMGTRALCRRCRGHPFASSTGRTRVRGPLERIERAPDVWVRSASQAQAMAFCRLASMAARKSWVFSHGLSLEISSARSLVI